MTVRNKWISRLLGTAGLWTAFTWGFLEATVFFIIPDLMLSLTALFGFRAACRQLGWMIVGSVLGGILIYFWAARYPDAAHSFVDAVPFVTSGMWATVQEALDQHGASGLVLGPFSGIPYKVYAAESASRFSPGLFVLFSMPARLSRLLGSVLLFGGIGYIFRRKIEIFPARTVLGWGLYWMGVYIWYWGNLLGGTL